MAAGAVALAAAMAMTMLSAMEGAAQTARVRAPEEQPEH